MTYPDFHIFAVKVFCKGEDTVVWLFYQLFVLFRVNVLNVEHHEVRYLTEFVQLGEPFGIAVGAVGDAGAVKAGMNAALVCHRKSSSRKSSCINGSPPVTVMPPPFVERFVALIIFENLRRLHQRAGIHLPRVGIVTISTSHRTALHKNYVADAGAVNSSKKILKNVFFLA